MLIIWEELASGIVLMPVMLLLGKFYFRSWHKTLCFSIFALYLAAVYFLVGLPTMQFLRFDVNLNLIPFVGMAADGRNTLLNVLLFVPLGALLPMLFGLPTMQFLRFDVNLNLIPFVGMAADGRNTLLNVLLFVPLGALLPMLFAPYQKFRKTLLFSLAMTCAIELMQLLTLRATDINDVIANTVGGALGWGLYRLIPILRRCPGTGTKHPSVFVGDDLRH